ncbi:patatin-like phospholipase family protein [uncultured Tenacibaculum sp.]|uniref:patatin-like phospholipase family protein n=1 Tax=uncultured Tenacibaculum sp. TaxID=174713 RepID=UPI0026084382|nr:patatin-like phospholipase family protein [uncultured Tenacibaculum sp.]
MKNIGVVFSGGGALATAHLGLLKVLEEQGIQPTHFSGNSAGALIGTLYAYEYSVEDILEIISKEQWLAVPFQKLKEKRILDINDMFEGFKNYLPETFKSENVFISATDINSGEVVTYNSGDLKQALKASVALSTFFKPVEYLGKHLVDSALLDNFHVAPLQDKCDVIYGSYAIPMTPYHTDLENNVQQLLNRLFAINSYQRAKPKFNQCDYMLDHQYLNEFKVLDKDKLSVIYEKSYEYCKRKLEFVSV